MASIEFVDTLKHCPSPGNGCFASDPEALVALVGLEDLAVRLDLHQVANAAFKAAKSYTPLEVATYEPIRVMEVDQLTDPVTGKVRRISRLVQGEPCLIVDSVAGIKLSDNLPLRVAQCAFACGATGDDDCPLSTPPADSK